MSSEAMEVRDAAACYAPQAEHGVPPGYKRTEVGVIPGDWMLVEIDSLGERSRPAIKAGPFGSSLTKDTYVASGYKVYGQEQVIRGDYLYGDYFISEKKYRELESCSVRPGDILLSLVGTAGKLLVIPEDALPGIINPRLVRLSFDKSIVYPGFFKYLFESNQIQKYLASQAQGGTMDVLNATMLRNLVIPLPKLGEQRAIAAALSDVDALITALDRLIAKKRAIKTAAMQQLLTGKTRLPGFTGEWETKRLRDVCKITTGSKDVNEGNPSGRYPFFTCSRNHTYSDSYSFDAEAILIAGNGDVGNLHYYKGKFEAYQRTYVLYDFSIAVEFLWYQLSLFLAPSLGIGTIGTSIPYIKMENLKNFEFRLPINSKEQTAIAQVLSDMDAEIAALESRRDKTRAIKQGMMQQLLTGRVRLLRQGGS